MTVAVRSNGLDLTLAHVESWQTQVAAEFEVSLDVTLAPGPPTNALRLEANRIFLLVPGVSEGMQVTTLQAHMGGDTTFLAKLTDSGTKPSGDTVSQSCVICKVSSMSVSMHDCKCRWPDARTTAECLSDCCSCTRAPFRCATLRLRRKSMI